MSTPKKKDIPALPRGHAPVLEEKLATPIPKAQKKALTPREWNFVQELVMGDGTVTMREAAIRAGYPAPSAKETARMLTDPTRKPHVVAAIQELRHDMAERYGTTMERHMRDLQNIRDLALQAGAYSAAVQAEYRRGQALGTIYIDRKEIRHGTIDSMSKDEVMRKLEEIRRVYGNPGPIIDITPKQIESSMPSEPRSASAKAQEVQSGEQADPEPDPFWQAQEALEQERQGVDSSEPEKTPQSEPVDPRLPKRIGRPLKPENAVLLDAHIAGRSIRDKKSRERAIVAAKGKPTRLPFHPPRE